MIHDLRHLKIKEIAILTGDREPVARAVAKRVHADTVQAELLPADKAHVDRGAAASRAARGHGRRRDQRCAGPGPGRCRHRARGHRRRPGRRGRRHDRHGRPAARAARTCSLLSRKTIAIIRQNIIGFAFGLNAVAMLSATFGILGPVAAAILHQVGSLLVLLNSMRLLVFGDWWELPPLRQVRALGCLDQPARRPHRFRACLAVDLGAPASRSWVCVCALLLLGYATSGWTTVGPDEVGLLQRFGRYRGVARAGLAPALALSDRAGHDDRARPGPQPGDRLPRDRLSAERAAAVGVDPWPAGSRRAPTTRRSC